MKKYLMTGMAAVALCGAFTSCSRESDFGAQTPQQSIQETYETAFKTRFGEPAPEQDWGFGTRALTRAIDPTQEQRAYPNGNQWATQWLVPDTLTDGQKLRVQKYFQYNQYPGGTTDPDLVNFFVQQVYDGHDDPLTNYDQTMVNDTLKYSTEQYLAANGSTWIQSGENMDKLTAGSDNIHIYNFNNGNAGVYANVLDNGEDLNTGSHHPDKIMLMLNTKTDCFGYWNSNASYGHNDRYRLVSAAVIDAWAEQYGNGVGEAVTDKWNRDFIGFDFDQLPDSACYAYDGNNIKYATTSDGPSSYDYDWDGTKVIPVNSVAGTPDRNITSNFTGFWNSGESKNTNSDGTITFHAVKDGGMNAWYGTNTNFSGYTSLVVEFAETTTVPITLFVELGDASNSWGQKTQSENAGVDQIELVFSEKGITDWNLGYSIRQFAIQANESGDLKISRIYLKGPQGIAGYGTALNIPFLTTETNEYCGITKKKDNGDFNEQDDSNTANNGIFGYHSDANFTNVQCLNLPFINKMVSDGYLPVNTKNFREWTKVGGCADGYFSDWIVTIAKANPVGTVIEEEHENSTVTESLRVIAEDLSVGESTDFDFNDVVFDVIWTKNYTDETLTSQSVKVVLQAAGGTLPLYVAGHEVHGEFGEDTNVMINTKAAEQGYRGNDNAGTREIPLTTDDWSGSNIYDIANSIDIYVIKNETECHLSAPVGGIASKIGVKTNYKWCKERQDIEDKYSLEDGTSPFREWVNGIYPADDWYGYAKNEIVKYRAAKAALNGE